MAALRVLQPTRLDFLIVAAIYIGLAESARLLPAINPAATPLWPPTGFALALVLLGGYRIWPGILVGSVSPYLMAGGSFLELGSVGIGTLLAAFAGTWLIGRWSNGRQTFVPLLVSQSLQSFPLRRPR